MLGWLRASPPQTLGLEFRQSGYTDIIIDRLHDIAAGGGTPRADLPVVELVSRAFSSAQVDGPIAGESVTPLILSNAIRDMLVRSNGFAALIEVNTRGQVALRRADRVEINGTHRNHTYDLYFDGYGSDGGRVARRVAASRVLHLQYSPYGSLLTTLPALSRTLAQLERALGNESSAAAGTMLFLGARETDPERPQENMQSTLRSLAGRLWVSVVRTTGEGSNRGASVFQPNVPQPVKLGPKPSAEAIELLVKVDDMLADALGVSRALRGEAGSGQREALRTLAIVTLMPLARQVETEIRAKLDPDTRLSFPTLTKADISSRARAYAQLVKAKMPAEEARKLAGLED